MNIFNIERAYRTALQRGWDKLYWAVDIHDTVLYSDYKPGSIGGDMFPGALECLRHISWHHPEIVLIAFTCGYNHKEIKEYFGTIGINFKYVNENPECGSTDIGDFSQKLYYNVLLDDKAGFEGEKDWPLVLDEIKRIEVITATWEKVPWRKNES